VILQPERPIRFKITRLALQDHGSWRVAAPTNTADIQERANDDDRGRMTINYAWRGEFTNAEIEPLHAAGFERPTNAGNDWWTPVNRYSLGWVCARDDGRLVGFVNVAWDGGVHAFILDTVAAAQHQPRGACDVAAGVGRRGVGTRLVAIATENARAAGCEWLHVDFEPHLRSFYFDACGFRPTDAGLIQL
jgi:GNAT superfamily N-acetyltransferase